MEKTEVGLLLSEDNTLGELVGPATSTSLDTLQFKHDFFEVLEELQLRRQEDEEHKKKLQDILKDKYELEKKLEDYSMVNSQLVEKNKTEQEEIRHGYEEKMRALQEEKAKANINSLCEDGQVSRLKDEIRALHLHKYNLEKTVSEQEHKLHLQTSSHEQFLSLVRQLEEKCTTLSQQVTEVNEHLDLLSNNVDEATVINAKLERQQKHHDCVVISYQDELAATKKELLRLTTKFSIDQQADKMGNNDSASIKDMEHQLKMQQDMTVLLEKQIEELQKENASITNTLKESSSLLERQADSFEQTKSNNVSLHQQLVDARHHSEVVSVELAEKSDELIQLEKKHQQEEETHSKKLADMEQRLRALQSDFLALQQSYESVQCEREQWLKKRAQYTATVTDKTARIVLLEEQLNKQLNDANPGPVTSTNIKSPDLIKKVVSDEMVGDNKRKCTEDAPFNKKICLSPSLIDHEDSTLLPSTIHDSPAMPVASVSHDPSATLPQSNSNDVPVKAHSPCEHSATPPQSSTTDPISSPSSHDIPATPPELHDAPTVSLQANSVDPVIPEPTSHDPVATPPQLHDASVKFHSSSQQHNTPVPQSNTDLLSTSPPLLATDQQDQLEFGDPTACNIINTQLNQQINKVQHFLKTDRLKRTRLPDNIQ